MKTKLFLLALMIFPLITMGQIEQKNVAEEVKVMPPVFTGIQNVVDKPENQARLIGIYLMNNFQYPATAAKFCQQGTGVVRFVVRPTGELVDFQVINSVCPELDRAFVKVLKSTSGEWNPGYNNGKPVEMEKEVSMLFVANREWTNNPKDYFMKIAQNQFSKGNNLLLKKGKAKKALRFYNESVKYLPYETSSLLLRGLCKYELGDEDGACSDWNRINAIGLYDADLFIENLCELKGYEEMTQILKISEK